MLSYRAYGLGIHSSLPLPEFRPAEAGCDVVIRFDSAGRAPSEIGGRPWYVRVTPDEAVIVAQDLGVFMIRRGREVTVIPARGVDELAIRHYIAGTVMAIVLYQRGRLALHASAVEVGGAAVAFLGQPGAGKSSMAAALHAREHAVVADDVTAVQVSDASAVVFPAFPQLKLMPEAAASAGCDSTASFSLPGEAKRGYRLNGGFQRTPLPFRQLYILAEDTTTSFERVSPREAVVELVRHSYPTRMLQRGGSTHFLHCARLARTLPIYRMKRPRSLALLRDVAGAVEEHLARTVVPDDAHRTL